MYNHSLNLEIFNNVFCGALILKFSTFADSSKLKILFNLNVGTLCLMCEDGQVNIK